MNDPTLVGPCADYEHDLVDLHDGVLAPERARIVRLHVANCTRCRDWAAEFAAIDGRLAATLPRVELSPDFGARLHARLAALPRPASTRTKGTALELEREHDSLLEALRRATRRRALLGATGSVAVTVGGLLAARDLLSHGPGLLASLPEGPERWAAFGMVGIVVAVAALAWTAVRNGLPLPGLAR